MPKKSDVEQRPTRETEVSAKRTGVETADKAHRTWEVRHARSLCRELGLDLTQDIEVRRSVDTGAACAKPQLANRSCKYDPNR